MIVGRESELKWLEHFYQSNKAVFIAILGDRCVGKTYLIREFFRTKQDKFFEVTGLHKESKRRQLTNFMGAVSEMFFEGQRLQVPNAWHEAFDLLTKEIEKTDEKVVIFLDDFPWLATKGANLSGETDYYWNRHWSSNPNVTLVICGLESEMGKMLYRKSGLHIRTSLELHLKPFNLAEKEQALSA